MSFFHEFARGSPGHRDQGRDGPPQVRLRRKTIAKLKDLGPGAIEPVFAALPDADKNATVAFVEVLTGLVSQKTFPQFIEGLIQGSPRVIAGIAWALTSNRNYPPHPPARGPSRQPGIAKSAILEVIAAQKSRFGVRELLNAAYAQEPNEKAGPFSGQSARSRTSTR